VGGDLDMVVGGDLDMVVGGDCGRGLSLIEPFVKNHDTTPSSQCH
jgi:hypothetical protein